MRFNPEEFEKCSKLFNNRKSTSQVQEYLMNKYNCERSKTSNFIKLVRKRMGIYKKNLMPG